MMRCHSQLMWSQNERFKNIEGGPLAAFFFGMIVSQSYTVLLQD
ncbi:MAG: hypothetical protein GAK37_01235 [Pseudomonas sp.]|nr:MAG: hypothetical protein GAK37_01235 [Pseudomonas sp.]